ncbi:MULTISPECIES: ABC transporter permease [Devosia]|uniref:L-arabinose transporter permease protein n=2 Tax=Devosia equisanguinis TaxID=2490941 RepID=A0A3S4CA28_9HYPH|nr:MULTISPECIES: ABC transporter permease [Devosia]ODT47800.1 MAG: sugar ABC transporter permease [Pelagibacterium sp. SCN 63-126]ODU87227.1 MAG: sugar ABC transporter permease [Pelagibacterium sp. SCN 63-17]OJX42490.1 MAG: sugar ABC transporter permease [Devosia sp. 63-57]VDS03569.1 L-arabinose transporter permease protein [Devosia equisanguinis]
MDMQMLLSLLDATIRLSTPLLLACLAGMYSERSGVFDIGLEGKMLAAAFAAGAIAAVTGSAWLGLLAALAVSIMTALLQGAAAISLKGNQLIAGVAINMLAAGLTTFLGQQWFRQGGRTPQLSGDGRFGTINLPFAQEAAGVPIIGPIYSELISGHYILVYVAFLAVPITAYVLYRTRFGLRLRAVGENPKAVDTAGISVVKLRYQAVLITGLLCGFAGAYFSIAQGSGFGNNMTAGKGFIALAALIFAKWKPVPAMFTCLLFGFLDALQIRLQGASFGGIEIPVQAIQALPYVLTVVLLAGFIGKAVGPKAGGVPYTKER